MGLFDRFREGLGVQRPIATDANAMSADDQAIARYRYMLRTAPPETLEQAHAEAFAQLTPEQRRRVLEELALAAPEAERAAVMRSGDSPGALARVATRAEIREPGAVERIFGGMRAGPAASGFPMGGLFAGSFLSSMAGTVLGSMIAQHFFANHAEAAGLFGDSAHGGDPSLAQLGRELGPDGSSDDGSTFGSDGPDGGGSGDGFGGDFGGGTFDI